MSDPVGEFYQLIITKDGGKNWNFTGLDKMPRAKDGEAAFAASGTCLIVSGKNDVFLVSGGSDARVFRSNDRGLSWFVANTPITKGTPGSGIFSIAMRDAKNGVIVGGNYEKPDERNNTSATTQDDGRTWQKGAILGGYRSAAAYIDRNTIIAVGPNGSDVSFDRRLRWQPLGSENLNAVASKGTNATWAVGPNGAVYKLNGSKFTNRSTGSYLSKIRPPHLANITAVELSHLTISSNCNESERNCNASRQVLVRTTYPVIDYPFEVVYTVSGGKIIGDGANVTWDLNGAATGKHTITAGLSMPNKVLGWEVFGQTVTKLITIE